MYEDCVCVLLLQDLLQIINETFSLLQSCSRGGGRVEYICYERRRAEACVDESAHHAQDLGSRLLQRLYKTEKSRNPRLGKQGWACRRVAGEAQLWCKCKYSEDTYACVFIDRKKSGMLPGRAAYYRASPRG